MWCSCLFVACDVPKLRKKSRTFERMPHQSKPPLDYKSTFDFCSSLATVLVDSMSSDDSDEDCYDDDDSHEERETLVIISSPKYEEISDDNSSTCDSSIETDERLEEDFHQNAVSSINIFQPTNRFSADFSHRELVLSNIEVIEKRLKSLEDWTWIDDTIIDVCLLLLKDHAEKKKKFESSPIFCVHGNIDNGTKYVYELSRMGQKSRHMAAANMAITSELK